MAIVLPRQLQDDDSPIPFIIPPSLSIARQYGIVEVNDFTKFLDSNTIIAGSFALASYLIQEGIEVDFEPNDIDIFVSTEKFGGIDKFIDEMTVFMARFRYTLREEGYSAGDYDCDNGVKRVISFNNRAINKKIQIIVVETFNITVYVATFFDLSVCATWFNNKTNRFETLAPDRTLRKEMYELPSCVVSGAHGRVVRENRIQKYIDRGFRIIREPCPVICEADDRADLDNDKFNDIAVYNIFTLEEVPIRCFLRSCNEWNIVLKAGEQYYGFDRRELVKYMKTKKTYVRRIDDEVYETPFNHCITTEALKYLEYADYTMYEVDSTITVTVNGVVKSLFHLVCYSVKQWCNNTVGMILSPVICV